MATTANLCEVDGVVGLYCDALVTTQEERLLYVSLWGRDTAVQEFLGRLTVPVREGGLDSFSVILPGRRMKVFTGNVDNLGKLTGRMPKGNLFGEMVHLWLYDPVTLEPDRANRHAVMLQLPESTEVDTLESRIWSLVRSVCHLPLLDCWQDILMADFYRLDWIHRLDKAFGLDAISINLGSEQVEPLIRERIRNGDLLVA